MKALVTGATGFIGTKLCNGLGWRTRISYQEAMKEIEKWIEQNMR
jgi:nucleoside-diphosphate-sugar epimerase